MEERKGKWEFLLPIVERFQKNNPAASLKDIASAIVQDFKFEMHPEAMRKIISRLVNDRVEDSAVNFVQVVDPHYRQPKVTFTSYTGSEPENKPVLHKKITTPGKYLILGCWHVPFHNQELTKRIYDLMDTHQFQGLIINGDFLDLNSLSGHDRGKFTAIPGLTLNKEYEEGRRVIDNLISFLPPGAEKVFMYGNHEDRYQRFIADMQNAKTPPQSPTEGLDLYRKGFTVFESYASGYLTLGNHLDVLHGIYYNTHCAKTHIDRFRGSVVFAHTHRIQSYIEGRTGGFNIGWGGDVTHRAFNYADRGTKASWQNGFAEVTIDEEGNYFINQMIAYDNKFTYGGKLY